MTNNIKFGFFKNKFDAGSTSTVDSYPAYPEIPTAEVFNTFVNRGYVSQGGPVANVNTDLANVIVSGSGSREFYASQTHSLPNGDVLIYEKRRYLGGNIEPIVYIYDFQTGTITNQTPAGQANVNGTYRYSAGCIGTDNRLYIYEYLNKGIGGYSAENVSHVDLSDYRSYDRLTLDIAVGHEGNANAISSTYYGVSRAITLVDGNILLIPTQSNNANIMIHATEPITVGNVTYTDGYFKVTSLRLDPYTPTTDPSLPVIQDPVTGKVYFIPGHGLKANGNVDVSNINRCIAVYDPSSNITQRIEPANIDLSETGDPQDRNKTLYGCVAYGVDKKFYAFPGLLKKDILVFDPATEDGVQSTFNIFNTNGSNTIISYQSPILATDGNIYVKSYGSQESLGSNANSIFYISIDTKPDSATYQQGSLIYVNPANILYGGPTYIDENSRSIAGDNLIITALNYSANVLIGEGVETIQISAPTGYNQVSRHPVLNINNVGSV